MNDFILGTWMRYKILSVTGFSSSRREVVVYHFIALIFCYFLGLRLSRKLCLQPPQFYSISGVNNAHFIVITGINTFSENKNCQKAAISSQKDVPSLFQLSLKKLDESFQKV